MPDILERRFLHSVTHGTSYHMSSCLLKQMLNSKIVSLGMHIIHVILRVLSSYEPKIAKIYTLACNSANKPPFQNLTKLNYWPECPEVAEFCYFCLIAIISPWKEQLLWHSARMRQTYNFQWKFPPGLTPACSVVEIWWKLPLEIILLPHSSSGRGSHQLLLSIPETSELASTLNYLSFFD